MGSFVSEREMRVVPIGKGTASDDFSRPCLFNLATQKPNKTVDIGRNGVAVSLDAQGRVLQASTFHSTHGIAVAVPFEQFDGTKFWDASYVRAYRTRMLRCLQEDRAGFGLDFGRLDDLVSIQIQDANTAVFRFQLNGFSIAILAQVTDEGSILQCAYATNTSASCLCLPYSLRMGVSLNRASYGQLTEGGPLTLPLSHNRLHKIDRTTLSVCNPHLGAQLVANFNINGQPIDLQRVRDQEAYDAPLDTTVKGQLCVPPGEIAIFQTRFRLLQHTGDPERRERFELVPQQISDLARPCWRRDDFLTTYIVRRNVDYILAGCVVPVSETAAAIITDHVALPLGWNRDNYWQTRLLLTTIKHIQDLVNPPFVHSYEEQIRFAAQGHLEWVFNKAQRPYGFWHRSYLVNGQPKDPSIFQLDQQCYPLLELCDYLDNFPEEIRFVRTIIGTQVVHEILTLLGSKQDVSTGLWPTEETPGDDAVIYPYHFSSHVLLWRTLTRLRDLLERLEASDGLSQRLDALAKNLRDTAFCAFTFHHPRIKNDIFAYLTDGRGQCTFYHDANDIPTLFATEWGFVTTTEEVAIWTRTMEFGLSSANETGYCSEGPYSGLGSVHSPGAWTLGYFQELAYASLMNNPRAMRAAWTKIAAAMHWDGTFSEAVDPITAECTSKAWFSWPGAMIGTLLIQMRKNGQEKMLLRSKQ
ncbi:Six-hairpin glycosidase-like protein [Paraphoma chrysanthemicola]|uniref:Six-hairpin glycosidase-like protein n=1 Tax=Paraphoma chrysanthemicola TaxID=798071 RepID=A0A8K0RDF2_9PLEO|nr:Six-hairpin glycosidase-like protein [Paraphoma chrysanthemicola]